jgi:hypothetical protein
LKFREEAYPSWQLGENRGDPVFEPAASMDY